MQIVMNNFFRLMKFHLFLLIALLLLLPQFLRAQSMTAPDLMVHGDGFEREEGKNPVWVAEVGQMADGKGEATGVLFRPNFGSENWNALTPIPARIVGITSHRHELVVLFKDRTAWAWYSMSAKNSGERFFYGPNLPQRDRMIALAGDAHTLWALGQSNDSASTTPTTKPSGLGLYLLKGDSWSVYAGAWPIDIDASDPNRVSMVVIQKIPHLAVASPAGPVYILRYSQDEGRWQEVGKCPRDTTAIRPFKLLNFQNEPALWVGGATLAELGQIYKLKSQETIQLRTLASAPDALDLTIAGDQLWAIFTANRELYQQRFSLDGTLNDEKPKPITSIAVRNELPMEQWFTIGVMTVLTLVIISSLFRRRAQNSSDDNDESNE
jgi:hypothetical protein